MGIRKHSRNFKEFQPCNQTPGTLTESRNHQYPTRTPPNALIYPHRPALCFARLRESICVASQVVGAGFSCQGERRWTRLFRIGSSLRNTAIRAFMGFPPARKRSQTVFISSLQRAADKADM